MLNSCAVLRRMLVSAVLCTTLLSSSVAQPNVELRGAWIATLGNIDWPSKGNYDPERQKREFTDLLDMHERNGMNAIIVQIRPATDAFYSSPYEPWSEWLTGKQGRPPFPFYDPLTFMITETHKRGMEFHAWCNPYRAEFNIGVSSISPEHITRLKPQWFITYGNKRYFDPGNKEAQQYLVGVITDIVRRYDIDAMQFDDYFYPPRIAGRAFPDQDSYLRYGAGLRREDWRRSNVDSIILHLSMAIKKEKPFCKFGISPFGVWRNKSHDEEGSDTRGGLTNYDDLYANVLLWLKNGWIDYVAPQLYWELGHRRASYEVLVEWWSRHAYGRHVYVGHAIYRAEEVTARWKDPRELPAQIRMLRKYAGVQGSMFFSSRSFLRNPLGWNDSLQQHYYKFPALVPPMKWIDSTKPRLPLIERQMDNMWKLSAAEDLKGFVIYCQPANPAADGLRERQILRILPADRGKAVFYASPAEANGLAITALSRTNIESDSIIIKAY